MFYIPEELQKLKQWTNTYVDSKTPFPKINMPDTWLSYDVAYDNVARGWKDYLGFIFNDTNIIGIDLDQGFDNDGFLSPMAVDIINRCNSFTEYSKHGRGVHIYIKGVLPLNGYNNESAGIEMYKSKRYFVVTGNCLIKKDINTNQEVIDYILDKYFKDNPKLNKHAIQSKTIYTPEMRYQDGKLHVVYPIIKQGCRNISLASLAGQLYVKGVDRLVIKSKLLEVNQQACKPPLDDNEIDIIVNSITGYRRENK